MNAITHERTGGRGRYRIETGADGEAVLDYVVRDGVMAIMHTFSPPQARGQGLARRLVERAVEDAGAEGLRVAPVCSYAAALFDRRADWAQLRA